MISKKELLALTGISYGQLYRWKREGLIPEEWFVKQSSYTGQETFFPREQVISRVQSILDSKDLYSLEELAKMFSGKTDAVTISENELNSFEEIDVNLLPIINTNYKKEQYKLEDIALFVAISQSIQKLSLTQQQADDLIRKIISATCNLKNMDSKLIVFMLAGFYHIAVSSNDATIVFDSDIEIVDSYSLSEITNKIKIKYQKQFSKKV